MPARKIGCGGCCGCWKAPASPSKPSRLDSPKSPRDMGNPATSLAQRPDARMPDARCRMPEIMVLMKTEFTEVSETRKHLTFEVEPDVVEAEITRVTADYSRSARIPGFRQGKVPAGVVRQRFKDQILYDVANGLIPKLVGAA